MSKPKTKSKRGPGRPPKPENKKLVVVGTRVSPRIFELLKKRADASECSVGLLLRTICRDAVK